MDGKRYLKISFSDVMGWIIGCAGVVATIVSAFLIEKDGFYTIFIGLLLLELLTIVIWALGLIDKYKRKNEVDELHNKAEELKMQVKKLQGDVCVQKGEIIKQRNEMMQRIADISINIKNASKLNNEFCTRIPGITEKSYHLLEVFSEHKLENDPRIKKELSLSYKEFEEGLLDVYKRYSSNLLNYLVKLEEAYLLVKGYNMQVSATIKLFNRPYFSDGDSRKEIHVYTAFRDKYTYEKKQREIGEELYTIDGNVDFVHCLKKDHFIINNAKKDSDNYMNEHTDFDRYYNCAIVVAIRTKLPGNRFKHFGYLCCDCLSQQDEEEIFDTQSANLLFAIAKQYATYLDTLDANWYDRMKEIAFSNDLPKTFLELIYGNTFMGK